MRLFHQKSGKVRPPQFGRLLHLRFERLESRDMLSVADVSAWAGLGNQSSPNNYAALSTTSAGGTLDSRRFGGGQTASYLADTSLNVPAGPLNATTSGGFGATGTLSFDASVDNATLVDPVVYFGFFDKDALTSGAFGFSFANQTTTSFRVKSAAGTTQSTTAPVVTEGTYTFDLDVIDVDSGSAKVRFRMFNAALATVCDASVTIPGGLTLQADSFGILQPLAASGSDAT